MNPFAGLIEQIQTYQPEPQRSGKRHVDPYDRITAVERMRRGESPESVAQDLDVSVEAVRLWRRKARDAGRGQ